MAYRPIDPNVLRICKRWAGSSPAMPRLVHAIIVAEGGTLDHLVKAVRCSVPIHAATEQDAIEQAIEITCRTITHHMADFLAAGNQAGFVSYLGAKWAPIGVANDPTALNKNWIPNVLKSL